MLQSIAGVTVVFACIVFSFRGSKGKNNPKATMKSFETTTTGPLLCETIAITSLCFLLAFMVV